MYKKQLWKWKYKIWVNQFLFLLSFSLCRIAMSTSSIQKARETFRVIAQRAAVCFDTTQYMRQINPLYQTSFSQFRQLFEAAISHSDRSAVKQLIDKLTQSAFQSTTRSLFERDKLVYALLRSIEVSRYRTCGRAPQSQCSIKTVNLALESENPYVQTHEMKNTC